MQPSDYVSLSDEAFLPEFEALWEAHIEFGTSRSHKKLLGKKRKRDLTEVAADAAHAPAKAKLPKRSEAAAADELPTLSAAASSTRAPPSKSVHAAPRSEPLASKGRWGSTMAARLLGGGS